MCEFFKIIYTIKKLRYLLLSIIIIAIILPVFFVFPFSIFAQESDDILIKKIDFDDYPKVEVYINFKEGSNLEYLDLKQEDFVVLENGESVRELSIKGMDEIPDPIGVVLVLDTSGSMKGEPIEDAIGAASFFVNEMRSIDKIAVVSFADNVIVQSDFTSDHKKINESISKIEASGETSLFDGIFTASELFKDADNIKHRYLIVLSDGADTASRHTFNDVIDKALQEEISVYSIALLSSEFKPEDIKNISESTGGGMLSAADSKELKELYKKISKKIINQYKISYTSLWPGTEDIDISVNIKKSELFGSTDVSYENPYYSSAPKTLVFDSKNYFYLSLFNIWWVKLIVYAVVFAAVTLLIYAVILFIPVRRQTLKDKAKLYGIKTGEGVAGEELGGEEEERKGFLGWMLRIISKAASGRGIIELFDSKLERAGMSIKASEFIALHVFGVMIISLLTYYLSKNLILTALIVILAVLSPFLLLNIKTSQRLKKFHEQLPDALQLISGSLKAGYSFNQAMSMVVEESRPPLSEELKRTLNEVRMGVPEREALENTAGRINSEYFNWAIMAVNVQREVGGNLAKLVETISGTIRERDRVMNRIRATTSEGRLSAIILIILPVIVAILMFIINREYIRILYTTKAGLLMLLFSGVMIIIGIIWIIKVISIKY